MGLNRLTYLAAPYTDPDSAVMEQRFDSVCRVAGKLMAGGMVVFCPVAHTHPIAVRCELPRDWGFWRRYDEVMLEQAGKVVVVKMPGWAESKGVNAEIEIAERLGIPVEFMEWPL
jgi:hypothetical protein